MHNQGPGQRPHRWGGDVDPVPTNVPEDRSVGSKMISPYHTHDYQPNARCESHTGPAEARSRSPAPTPSQGYRSDEAAPLVLSRTLSARYADFRLFTFPGSPYLHTFTAALSFFG